MDYLLLPALAAVACTSRPLPLVGVDLGPGHFFPVLTAGGEDAWVQGQVTSDHPMVEPPRNQGPGASLTTQWDGAGLRMDWHVGLGCGSVRTGTACHWRLDLDLEPGLYVTLPEARVGG
jgi:hypothetical protein